MESKQINGCTALHDGLKIVGWVLLTTSDQFVYKIANSDQVSEKSNSKDEAKAELLKQASGE